MRFPVEANAADAHRILTEFIALTECIERYAVVLHVCVQARRNPAFGRDIQHSTLRHASANRIAPTAR